MSPKSNKCWEYEVNGMKKKILVRCLVGAPIGLAVSVLISIAMSLAVGDGVYYAVVPELARDCGGELNAVALQAVLSLVYGAAWGGASAIWEMDRWSLLKQTAAHLVVCSLATFPIAYFTRWMSHSLPGILGYFGVFFLIYAAIWASLYSALKRRVAQMNRKLNGGEKPGR